MCYHKPYTLPPLDDGVLLPIHVGKAISDTNLHMQADNELNGQPCDNISDKNDIYCELTAIYWAWKNLKTLYPNVEYIGLFHYRRFLTPGKRTCLNTPLFASEQEISSFRIDPHEVTNILENKDAILSTKIIKCYPINIMFTSSCYSFREGLMMQEVIREKFPDYYDEFIRFYYDNNEYAPCQLFIMKYDDFVAYCEWLFGILFEVERRINCGSRSLGYIGELLLNVYVRKNHMKIHYCDRCIFAGDGVLAKKGLCSRFFESIRQVLKHCYCEVTFTMIKIAEKLSHQLR